MTASGRFPSKEVLQAHYQFPTSYVIKAIAKTQEGLADKIVGAAKAALGGQGTPKYSVRQAEGGRHVAITLEIQAKDADAVLAVYQALIDMPGMVLLL